MRKIFLRDEQFQKAEIQRNREQKPPKPSAPTSERNFSGTPFVPSPPPIRREVDRVCPRCKVVRLMVSDGDAVIQDSLRCLICGGIFTPYYLEGYDLEREANEAMRRREADEASGPKPREPVDWNDELRKQEQALKLSKTTDMSAEDILREIYGYVPEGDGKVQPSPIVRNFDVRRKADYYEERRLTFDLSPLDRSRPFELCVCPAAAFMGDCGVLIRGRTSIEGCERIQLLQVNTMPRTGEYVVAGGTYTIGPLPEQFEWLEVTFTSWRPK